MRRVDGDGPDAAGGRVPSAAAAGRGGLSFGASYRRLRRMVCGDGIDRAMFYGRGAGKLPTASAVLGDVIEAVKHNVTVFSQRWESSSDDSFIEKIDEYKSLWYFRVPADSDVEGVGSYVHDNGISFVDTEELSFADAKIKAEKLGACAFMPVLV